MARVTVEDCEKVVTNRFDLVVLAAQRARQIAAGDAPAIETKDEKKTVVALREIAAQAICMDSLRATAINGFRQCLPNDDEEEDIDEISIDDSYNPYAHLEAQALEHENITVISDDELENERK
ncbi:MAG: DNA-directed RNA polymerase subunit omega [Alphaproteobacteria bacterium]|nr:DNA-directed RNA polymerase subunit omega [Alphaproteobacteria bacterium]